MRANADGRPLLLIVLSVMFGGLQKGTQVKGLGAAVAAASWVRG